MNRIKDFVGGTSLPGWIARIWSLLLFIFMVLRILTPDPYSVNPVPMEDWFLLSLWGLTIVTLLAGWRWPRQAAWLTIGLMFFRELSWVILKGGWLINFLIIWVAILPPAVLYLIANNKPASRNSHA